MDYDILYMKTYLKIIAFAYVHILKECLLQYVAVVGWSFPACLRAMCLWP